MVQATFLRDARQSDLDTARFGRLWNTGNYFFLDAIERHIPDLQVVNSVSEEPLSDTLILSMSNFLSPNTDMSVFADYIERYDFKRTVMIGAGAQALSGHSYVDLTPGTLRFVQQLSKRSEAIGVSGQYTAAVLNNYGVENVEVIGCPTIFWSCDPEFRTMPCTAEPKSFGFNITPSGNYRDKIPLLLERAIEVDAQYIAQDENYVSATGVEADQRRRWVSKYYSGPNADSDQVYEFLSREKHFYSVEDWIEYMRNFDFVCGTRFHGNMAFIQTGGEPLLFVHDIRTRELCDYLNLPYKLLSEYRGESFSELSSQTDFTAFNATYSRKYERYTQFLNRAGLKHNLPSGGHKEKRSSPNVEYRERMLNELMGDFTSSDLTQTQFKRLLGERSGELRSRCVGKFAEDGTLKAEDGATCFTESDYLRYIVEKVLGEML